MRALKRKQISLCSEAVSQFKSFETFRNGAVISLASSTLSYIGTLDFGKSLEDSQEKLIKLFVRLIELQFDCFDKFKIPPAEQSRLITHQLQNSKRYTTILGALVFNKCFPLLIKFSKIPGLFPKLPFAGFVCQPSGVNTIHSLLSFIIERVHDSSSVKILESLIKDFHLSVNKESDNEIPPFQTAINFTPKEITNDVLELLLNNNLDISQSDPIYKKILLFHALSRNDIKNEIYKRLLPKELDDQKYTELFFAALSFNKLEIAEHILNNVSHIDMNYICNHPYAIMNAFLNTREKNYQIIYSALKKDQALLSSTYEPTLFLTILLMGQLRIISRKLSPSKLNLQTLNSKLLYQLNPFSKNGLIEETKKTEKEAIEACLYTPGEDYSDSYFYKDSQLPYEIFKLLMPTSNPYIYTSITIDGTTLLMSLFHIVCLLGDINLLKELLNCKSFDPSKSENTKYFELMILKGFSEGANLFLTKGVTQHYVNKPFTPLAIAIKKEDLVTMQIILSHLKYIYHLSCQEFITLTLRMTLLVVSLRNKISAC